MDLSNIKDLKTAMQLAGIKPHKNLGQHFLVDAESMQAIVEAAEIQPTDTILEIGPGLGVMTEALAKTGAQVVAVETDETLAELLKRRLPGNVNIVVQDVMKYNLRSLPEEYKVVANVPYYITSPIIRLLMESPNPARVAVLLIQKEVAERIVASPGSMSILALSVQYYAEASIITEVPKDKFWPAPKVDSAVIKIVRREQPAFEADPMLLFRLIKAGFGEKRKQLRNSLAGGLQIASEDVDSLLQESGISPTARAQELSLGEWKSLYNTCIIKKYLS